MPIVLVVDPDHPDPDALRQAAAVLQGGGLVAFPTETVYGLGADAANPAAVERIFQAKGRPSLNPLIVHGENLDRIQSCVTRWPALADVLANHFWPGPLTLVLPRSSRIPPIVSAGLENVGARIPGNPVALGLIAVANTPLAAPSANRSTRISPTRAEHVIAELGNRVDLILDAGPTRLGLESTVLDLTTDCPTLLRPGMISAERIEETIGVPIARQAAERDDSRPASSPGQMTVHYAHRTPTWRIEPSSPFPPTPAPGERFGLLAVGSHDPLVTTQLRQRASFAREWTDPTVASRELYATLHAWDASGLEAILVLMPPRAPEWETLRDRLTRASRPWNAPS